MNKLCIISMSGGLDSTVLAHKAIADGYDILPINIKYGQKNKVELLAFNDVMEVIQTLWPDRVLDIVHLDLQSMLKSTLALYENLRDKNKVKEETGMEFYTPSRNLVFSTLAAMVGEVAAIAGGFTEIRVGLGVHRHQEYSKDYWDISPDFVHALDNIFKLNDCIKVSMYAPYVDEPKSSIVKDAIKFNVPVFSTWTCYEPQSKIVEIARTHYRHLVEYHPCLKCEACVERQKAGDEVDFGNINNYIQEVWEPIPLG